MINYRVSGFVGGTEQLREALSNTLIVSGARLSELADGLPHLRIEPRVGNGLTITTETATVAGYSAVDVSKLAVSIQSGGGLAFNGSGELYVTGAVGGGGDVVGPASATDNAIVRFDGPSGNSIKNSVVTIDDTGSIEGVTQIDFDTADASAAAGRLRWDSTDGTLKLILSGGATDIRLGQEEVQRVLNVTGTTLLKGKAVRVVGAQGSRKTVALAQSDVEGTSSTTFGVLVESIAHNAQGYVTISGYVRDLDTSAYAEGAILWLSSTTAGGITATRPAAPNHGVQIGFCVKQHASQGIIYVNVQNGYELDELHNVTVTSPAAGDMLRYTGSIWTNVASPNLAAGASYQINGTSVLSATTLGSGVTASSLTSVGTLTNLTVNNSNFAYLPDTTRIGNTSTPILQLSGYNAAELRFSGSNITSGRRNIGWLWNGSGLQLQAFNDAFSTADIFLTIAQTSYNTLHTFTLSGGSGSRLVINPGSATTPANAPLNLVPHTNDPTGVSNGDLWVTGTAIRARIGGVSYTLNGSFGDLSGPAGATNNALVRFDQATGKQVKNSIGILTDAGVLSGLTGLIVGTDPGGTEALRVGTGGIRTSGTIYAQDFVLLGGDSGSGFTLDQLSDVDVAGASPGQVLQFNGTNWVAGTAAGSSRGSTAYDGAAELVTSTTASNQVVVSLAAATYRSVKYQVQVVSGSNYHITELFAVHDGSITYVTEYAVVFSNASLASFAVDVNGGNLRLLVTPTNAVTTIKVAYTAVTA